MSSEVSAEDLAIMSAQRGREIRGVVEIAHRCACGKPDVVKTLPRLPDGTPFPTTYYITCPRLTGLIGGLEADGVMREMEAELAASPELQAAYQRAHESYLEDRAALGQVDEIEGISAGGMPTRVKCLHVLVGHSLAKGPGVNPFGDKALEMLGDWAANASCLSEERA
ncbi:MAG: hypothetical protein RL441_304 [Actinomycetota bacterium]